MQNQNHVNLRQFEFSAKHAEVCVHGEQACVKKVLAESGPAGEGRCMCKRLHRPATCMMEFISVIPKPEMLSSWVHTSVLKQV